MKMPLEWHEKCLANFEESTRKQHDRARSALEKLRTMEAELKLRKYQLAEAKRLGLDGYDGGRFRVKRTTDYGAI